jgi:PAS domain S-box-containing protein
MVNQHSTASRYGLAVGSMIVAFILRWAVDPFLGDRTPYVTFFPVIALTGYYLGVGPAMAISFGSMLLSLLCFIPPHGVAPEGWGQSAISVLFFLMTSGTFILFSKRIADQRRHLQAELLASEVYREERERTTRQFQMAADVTGLGVCEWNLKTNAITWTRRHFEIFGYEPMSFKPTLSHFINRIHPEDRAHVQKILEECRINSSKVDCRFRVSLSDGEQRWVHALGVYLYDQTGTAEFLHGIVRDVTLEENERKNSRELAALMDALPAYIWTAQGPEGRVIKANGYGSGSWNKALQSRHQDGANESLDLDSYVSFSRNGVEIPRHELPLQMALRTGQPVKDVELELRTRSGQSRILFGSAVPILDRHGRAQEAIAAFIDISERKRAEIALLQSEEEFRAMFELSALGKARARATDGRILRVNEQLCRITGYSREELLSKSIADLNHPDDWPATNAQLKELLSGSKDSFRVEKRYVRRDGVIIWVFVNASLVRDVGGQPLAWIASIEDISERKRAELEQQKFALLAQGSTEFIGICDLQGRPQFINRAGLEIVGLSEEQLTKVSVRDFFFAEDQESICSEFFCEVLRNGSGSRQVRFRHFQTGAPIWMVYNVSSIKDSGGQTVALATISQNISEQKRYLEALQESRKQLQLVIDNADAFIIYCDAAGVFQLVNRRYAQSLGMTVEDLIGKKIVDVLRSDVHPLQPYVERAISGEAVEFEVSIGEGDQCCYLHGSFVPDLSGSRVRGFVGLITDITRRRVQEEVLRSSEARLRTAIDAGKLGTWEWDIENNAVVWSDRIYEFHGITPDQFDGTVEGFGKLLHPEDAPLIHAKIQSALSSNAPYEFEFRAIRPNGEVRWLHTSARVIFSSTGVPIRMLGGTIDLT